MNLEILSFTIGIMILFGLLLFLIFIPKKTEKFILSSDNELNESSKKLLKMFGGDVSVLLSKDMITKHANNEKIDRIFRESNNPWKVTKYEFFVLRVIFLFAGILTGVFSFFLLKWLDTFFLWYFVMIFAPISGYMFPLVHYQNIALTRNNKFKSQLPEAIDYLTMALSGGGYSLSIAFEEATKYLMDGVMKDEFEQIISDLKTGKTIEMALTSFADRAPSQGIKAFSKALMNANALSVPMDEILKARAKASRRDLDMEIEKRIGVLPSKFTMIFLPTTAFSLIVVGVAPAATMLSKLL